MLRMLLEIVMVFGLVGGIFFVTKVLAKENLNNSNEEIEHNKLP